MSAPEVLEANASWLQKAKKLPEDKKVALLKRLQRNPQELVNLRYDWKLWARPAQLPPPEYETWLILAGRGFGKTRAGAEALRMEVESGRRGRIALVSQTPADAREVMVEGESGILNISPPHFRPHYEPSKRRLTWPNGARATIYSAENPEVLRGPQHDWFWGDELCAWEKMQETWDQLSFGLRLKGKNGEHPCGVITTTPKPTLTLKNIMRSEGTVITRGSTYDNFDNLSERFIKRIKEKYEGTRLGRQEIYAEVLEEMEGALWNRDMLDRARVSSGPTSFKRVVVGVDPQAKKDAKRKQSVAETGIVVVGLGEDGHGYVLADLSCNASPDEWARKVVAAYHEFGASRIVGENNQGGDMVESVIRTVDSNVPLRMVTASKGKWTRAEPVAALYEQNRVHHIGNFPEVEDQMCTWTGEDGEASPDRMDALVWALTELMVGHRHYNLKLDLAANTRSNPWAI